MLKPFNFVRIAGLLAVVALLAACTQPAQEDPRSAEEIVAERAQAWWQAHIDKDFGAAWELATPGFRETTPRDEFARNRSVGNLKYLDVQVREVECEEALCNLRADLTYLPVGAPSHVAGVKLTTTNREKWLKIDGQWWRSVSQ